MMGISLIDEIEVRHNDCKSYLVTVKSLAIGNISAITFAQATATS
jgi:hypothetical protein